MVDNILRDSQPHFGRKTRQAGPTSTAFDATQPTVIALLCVIAVLTVVYLILIIFLYRRFYVRDDKSSTDLSTNPDTVQEISPTQTTSISRNADGQHHSWLSLHAQQSVKDIVFNESHSCVSETMDPNQLHSYLFIDLHSTSSETSLNYALRPFTNHLLIAAENRSKHPCYSPEEHRSFGPRFLMRERTLSTNVRRLPQLRQPTMQAQKILFGLDDSESSTGSIISRTLPATRQNQVLQRIEEESSWFEMTSISLSEDDDATPTLY